MNGSKSLWLGVTLALMLAATCACVGKSSAQQPDPATRKTIDKKMAELAGSIAELRTMAKKDAKLAAVMPDVEIYHQAAVWVTRLNEFGNKETAGWTVEVLDKGLERAKKATKGDFSWLTATGRTMVRGYRSEIDESIQPYAVTLPADYDRHSNGKWRCDLVMHGRDNDLTEVKFLHQHGDKAAPKGLNYIKIDVYGRGNNAYRWAGEIDVLEAEAAVFGWRKSLLNDLDKHWPLHVLRGFSMGGAGAWHIGLHYPDKWCVIGPGAGFTTTHGYVAKMPADLGWPQEQMLRIYDAVPYAENAFNVPVVAYGGEKDPQLQASKNIEAALKQTKLPLNFQILVAPGLAHQFPAEWQKKEEDAYAPFVKAGRPDYPKRVRFVTYTLKYNTCDWVEIIGLEKHYEKAVVDAERTANGFKVATTNVDALRLTLGKEGVGANGQVEVLIDNQKVLITPHRSANHPPVLQKRDGQWHGTMTADWEIDYRPGKKVPRLQGPIDDAFTGPFLCIRGTGKPWSDRVHDYAEASLKRFQEEWAKYMRGDLPVKNDVDVTKEDIDWKNLILFGDPGSNSLVAKAMAKLPLVWTKEKLTIGDKMYDAQSHLPLMIYRNPLTRDRKLVFHDRYIVLNSGHTFHADDFKGTNALLYPRLGDYAVLKLADKGGPLAHSVVLNGLFDEQWKVYAGK
ncbi:MAG TPA: hypothetical protein VE988_00890 [Gemmataceae bacterium]|nr:hypothetical protein [Gemmataceae bacterium]